MLKKLVLLLIITLASGSAFAIEKNDINIEFFNKFDDDCLMYYINQAFDNNHSAKQAAHRVEQYRQQVKYSLGKELPLLSVNANYLGVKIPELDNFELKKNAFILPFMVNYEPDFLLKNRDKTRSAKKDYEAQKYDERAVYISLLCDVASVYTNILQYDELIRLAKENIDIYSELLSKDTKKYERGIITAPELNISKKNFETAKDNYEELQKQQEILLMQLAVLTGVSSDEAESLQRGNLADFEYSGIIPDEVSSDIIFQRPDVLSAETRLEKAKIDVRIARKEFLPSFNITGIWVFNTIAPGTFFSWESSLAAIMAGASQDIFMGGRKTANLKIQKSKYEELFENYKQTDLEAVKEVNAALCFIKHDTQADNITLKKLDYEYKNFNAVRQKFERGTISKPEYLANLSGLVNQQSDAVNSKTQRLVNYFTLYKAVGGRL